jgi:hypothetical protein
MVLITCYFLSEPRKTEGINVQYKVQIKTDTDGFHQSLFPYTEQNENISYRLVVEVRDGLTPMCMK